MVYDKEILAATGGRVREATGEVSISLVGGCKREKGCAAGEGLVFDGWEEVAIVGWIFDLVYYRFG